MKHITTILTSFFVLFLVVGIYYKFLSAIIIVMFGGVWLLCWLLFYLHSICEERDLLKEGNQYFIDTFQNIRNPISLIKTPLGVVCEKECPEFVKKEVSIAIHHIEGLEQHLTTLMGLKHSLVYSGNLDVAEHEISSFIKRKVNPLQSYAAGLDMTLEISPEFDYASAWFDQGKISPVIDKFVISAIDCALPDTHLVMQILLNDKYWAIKIKDSGNGLFLKYCKWYLSWLPAPKTVHRRQWKMGSTLFKRMLNLCDGKIAVSEGEVLLKFPVKCPLEPVPSHYEREKEYALLDEAAEAYLCPPFKKKSVDKPVVVLVDNDERFCRYLEKCLSDDFNIITFTNGSEALKSIHDEHPDLVICDVMLYGMSGDELSSKLKTSRDTSFIPIILLGSSLDVKKRAKRGYSLADIFMYKPFNVEDLKIEISVLIANSYLQRKSFLQKVFGEEFLVHRIEETQQENNLKFLDEVKNYVLDNLDKEDFLVDDLAANMCMSRTTFYNKWKSLTGEAPKYLISHIRMEKARELLESGKYSVTIVAEMVGMRNLKNFRSKYKEYFGKSPKEFLKKI
ncbi:helix-turn-helix domain-containing protein [Bacteroides sp.]|uniref:helix-turn-helix domain-containing protein n=1 Tax=Bacteroides sp. TaxID=29523 RepID=UPI0026348014|nr:helix-turn-helix domain-containing protein [Bacteroides sp.]